MSKATSVLKGSLAISLLVLISLWSSRPEDLRLVLIYLVPYLLSLVLPGRFTNFASGLVLGGVLIEIPFTLFFSVFGGIFPDPRSLMLMRVTSMVFVILAVVSVVTHRKEDRKTGSFLGGVATSIFYVLIAAFALSSATGHSTEIQPDPTPALGSIHACLALYAQKHGGQYPSELKELGPNGSQCLEGGLAAGHAGNMKITYRPQRENKTGNYSLFMENTSWFGKKSRSFYADESGVIHESFTTHPASPDDRVIQNASSILRSIANCLIQSGAPYPRDMQHFRDDPNSICSRKFMETGLQYHTHGAEVHYSVKADHEVAQGFTLTARPGSYGKDGVRSYFVDETGIVRGTSDDRAAGPDDPPVPTCEYDSNPCRT